MYAVNNLFVKTIVVYSAIVQYYCVYLLMNYRKYNYCIRLFDKNMCSNSGQHFAP